MHNIEIEHAVLGAMINDNVCLNLGLQLIPDKEAFASEANRTLYETLLSMSMGNKVIDALTVKRQLESDGTYALFGDDTWIGIAMIQSELHIFENHVEILLDDYRYRKVIKVAQIALNKAEKRLDNSQDVLFKAISELEAVLKAEKTVDIVSGGKVIKSIKDEILESANSDKEKNIGIPCGYKDFGEDFSFVEGELIIIGARPSMGKSALMIQLAKNLAVDQKIPVGIISLETKAKDNLYRLLANITGFDSKLIKKGFYNNHDREVFFSRSNQVMAMPLFINDTYDMSYMDVKANIMLMVRNFNCKVVFVDHLLLINILSLIKITGRESSAIGQVTRMLKILASELKITIVLLHQLSRKVEDRKPPRPMMSDLRDSGSIEQDADRVLFLYRPDYYAAPGEMIYDSYNRDLRNITEVILAKNRNGAIGYSYFRTDKKTSRFTEAEDFNKDKPKISKSNR